VQLKRQLVIHEPARAADNRILLETQPGLITASAPLRGTDPMRVHGEVSPVHTPFATCSSSFSRSGCCLMKYFPQSWVSKNRFQVSTRDLKFYALGAVCVLQRRKPTGQHGASVQGRDTGDRFESLQCQRPRAASSYFWWLLVLELEFS
jgi:hypothetical protein